MEPGDRPVLIAGGIAGVISVLAYAAGQSLPLALDAPERWLMPIFFGTALLFGPLGIANSYALYRALAWERQGALNRLAFVMSVIAFGLVTAMLLVQGTVNALVPSALAAAAGAEGQGAVNAAFRLVRGVDLGLDLAWDIFMGVSMILTAPLLAGHSRFGWWFAAPAGVLGALLIVLNGITAPFPPGSRGLVDIGPVVGAYGLVLSTYMARIGWQVRAADPAMTGQEAIG